MYIHSLHLFDSYSHTFILFVQCTNAIFRSCFCHRIFSLVVIHTGTNTKKTCKNYVYRMTKNASIFHSFFLFHEKFYLHSFGHISTYAVFEYDYMRLLRRELCGDKFLNNFYFNIFSVCFYYIEFFFCVFVILDSHYEHGVNIGMIIADVFFGILMEIEDGL